MPRDLPVTYLQKFLVVSLSYVLAHGLTAGLVTPLQSLVLPEITTFASLLYLPHGVRVLSAWLLGRCAFVPLSVGAFLSEALFTPADLASATDPVILVSIAVGAAAAPAAFEILRLFGHRLYAGRPLRIHWSQLLWVGVLASVINSVGQSIVFSESILPEFSMTVVMAYAVGDLTGLVVTTLVLMMMFRWMRLASGRG